MHFYLRNHNHGIHHFTKYIPLSVNFPKQCLELKSDYFEAGTDRERDDGTFTHCRTNMFEIPNSDLLDVSYLKQ